MVEANDFWETLDRVLDRRRKVVRHRCARDQGLIERGTWGELQRAIVTDQVKSHSRLMENHLHLLEAFLVPCLLVGRAS